jgi:tRNA(Ser,Leu) C12 N-acetylase TAN1
MADNNNAAMNDRRCSKQRKQKRKYVTSSNSSSSKKNSKTDPHHNPTTGRPSWNNRNISIPRHRPAILVSCDPTRELKCRREFLQILRHDWDVTTMMTRMTTADEKEDVVAAPPTTAETKPVAARKLTLDQELQQLRQRQPEGTVGPNQNKKTNNNNDTNGPFTAYDTGCKGSVLIVCTAAEPANDEPPQRRQKTNDTMNNAGQQHVDVTNDTTTTTTTEEKTYGAAKGKSDTNESPGDPFTASKKDGIEDDDDDHEHDDDNDDDDGAKASALPFRYRWDPVAAVDRIVAEMAKPSSTYPDSRYCTKITPFQTIIKADLVTIAQAVTRLIARFQQEQQQDQQHPSVSSNDNNIVNHGAATTTTTTPAAAATTTTTTFAIRIHRRLGSDHVTRNDLIAHVAAIVPSDWQVQLLNPKVMIWIEIIKTMAGVSILSNPIYNLTTIRERRSEAAAAIAAAGTTVP